MIAGKLNVFCNIFCGSEVTNGSLGGHVRLTVGVEGRGTVLGEKLYHI